MDVPLNTSVRSQGKSIILTSSIILSLFPLKVVVFYFGHHRMQLNFTLTKLRMSAERARLSAFIASLYILMH